MVLVKVGLPREHNYKMNIIISYIKFWLDIINLFRLQFTNTIVQALLLTNTCVLYITKKLLHQSTPYCYANKQDDTL